MKGGLLTILLLSGTSLFGQNLKFQGYVLNVPAFRQIHFYCVDTHNLPSDQVTAINHFVWRESRAKGLLTKLPWQRRTTCLQDSIDAILRLEFVHQPHFSFAYNDDLEGALLVFRPGSPSPIYETPAISVPGPDLAAFDGFITARLVRYNVAAYAVRILIHDWKQH